MFAAIEAKFDAAHYLPNYPGKCKQLHGHTWKVQLAVQGKVNPETGMVVDFSTLKEYLNLIISDYDHKVLNDIIPNPTCENICLAIAKRLRRLLPNRNFILTVQEGDGGAVTINTALEDIDAEEKGDTGANSTPREAIPRDITNTGV